MIKIKLDFGDNPLFAETQLKSFKDENAAVEFINKHHAKIQAINGILTYGEKKSMYDIMDAIKFPNPYV